MAENLFLPLHEAHWLKWKSAPRSALSSGTFCDDKNILYSALANMAATSPKRLMSNQNVANVAEKLNL